VAQRTRFTAATVPHLKTLIRSTKGGCQRRKVPPAPVTAPRRHARTSLHRHCHSTAPTVAAPARIFTEEREIAGTSSSTGEGPFPLLSALSCKSRTCITGKEKKRRNPTDRLSDDQRRLTLVSRAYSECVDRIGNEDLLANRKRQRRKKERNQIDLVSTKQMNPKP